MALSKRARFEVLRRDNHTCRYCGGMAPDAVLTVDHVTPVTLGGTDDPSNLVAACRDCNAGKGSTSPDTELVAQVGEDDMRWASAIQRASMTLLEESEQRAERHEWFLAAWRSWDKQCYDLPEGWAKSLDHWLGAGLPDVVLLECLDIALGNRNVSRGAVFAYMGGIARKRIERLHELAKAIIDEEAASDGA